MIAHVNCSHGRVRNTSRIDSLYVNPVREKSDGSVPSVGHVVDLHSIGLICEQLLYSPILDNSDVVVCTCVLLDVCNHEIVMQ